MKEIIWYGVKSESSLAALYPPSLGELLQSCAFNFKPTEDDKQERFDYFGAYDDLSTLAEHYGKSQLSTDGLYGRQYLNPARVGSIFVRANLLQQTPKLDTILGAPCSLISAGCVSSSRGPASQVNNAPCSV